MTLREKLGKDIILLDGAFGTYIQTLGLKEEHFGGRAGCMEYLSVSSPDLVSKVHSDYFDAGSDAVETNTFGGNALKLAEYGLAEEVYAINLASTKIARAAADKASSGGHPRFVVGTMGPTGKLPSSTDPVLGNISYPELKEVFREQAAGIIDGGADAILVETAQDMLEMKAAVNGARAAMKERGKDLVLMAQCTLANSGRMLLGTDIFAVISVLGYLGVDVIGLNCSTGPIEMEGAVKVLNERCPSFISVVPNAGLPVASGGETVYPMKPEEMAGIMERMVKEYGIDVIGGCCGTGPEHIRQMRERVKLSGKRPRPAASYYAGFYNGVDINGKERPLKVGERINTHGSRKMKQLLLSDDIDGVIELGKAQESAGADILDVCTVLTERNTERADAVKIVRELSESVNVPLMVDTTDTGVVSAALENYPGTMFINSVNLEDGGARAREVYAMAKEHGAFVVNLVIDESGMARTADRKVEVAERLYRMATGEFGIQGHRLIFDMLTFTLATGEDEYTSSALDTYAAIRRFKKMHPEALTALGVSNVSFGLKKPARKVLNMVFLHHAVKHGLDMAIIDPSEYSAYNDIPGAERKLADDLVLDRHKEALDRFVEHFENVHEDAERKPYTVKELTPGEKITRCVFERDKINIVSAVEEALKSCPPETIINDILMKAMKQVGDRLDSGEMVLPYVLQSAEVMRKAIEYLEPLLPRGAAGKRGKIVLATVFGDVHDIGKNLVRMILKNNGFEVIDLGKQVPVERIVEEAKKAGADAVGLSALLVSTARHMKTCVQEMHDAGLCYPVLIGGAPINDRFAREISVLKDKSIYAGGVFYSRDAFTGLKIMQLLMDPEKKDEVMTEYLAQFGQGTSSAQKVLSPKAEPGVPVKQKKTGNVPEAPFFGARPLTGIPADEVFDCLDEKMLFDISWGAKLKSAAERERIVREEYRPMLENIKRDSIRKGWLDLRAVYGYFKCSVSGEDMTVMDGAGGTLEKLHFSRPSGGKRTTLADYFAEGPEGYDIVAFQAVTVGNRISGAIRELTESGEETKAYFLHGFSVNLAEALAAYVHGIIRKELALGAAQGKRYSPGYPLWRNLADQEKIFRLLELPKYTDMKLTEEYQIVPEQSTTAMVVYNDKAEY